MPKAVLITGGAGFIGSHLADQLLRSGHRVRVLDNLSAQVHGDHATRPAYLHADVELMLGDVRDGAAVGRALQGIDRVCHLAATVGVGQSMYDVAHYTSVNNLGTAVLLEGLIRKPVERLVVASSMAIYGEGLYQTKDGTPAVPVERSLAQLRDRVWEVRDARGRELVPQATPESKQTSCGSVYALSKFDQEKLCLMLGQAYNISCVALRLFNVYGPRQALSNPYTSVLAIFASRLLSNNPPLIFEDGLQRRDFVSVHDVARACSLALDATHLTQAVFNIGSGDSHNVRDVAEALARQLGRKIVPEISERYREGDIRHCFAEISAARKGLGFTPEVSFESGLTELAEWLSREAATDKVRRAHKELSSRGLTV